MQVNLNMTILIGTRTYTPGDVVEVCQQTALGWLREGKASVHDPASEPVKARKVRRAAKNETPGWTVVTPEPQGD